MCNLTELSKFPAVQLFSFFDNIVTHPIHKISVSWWTNLYTNVMLIIDKSITIGIYTISIIPYNEILTFDRHLSIYYVQNLTPTKAEHSHLSNIW